MTMSREELLTPTLGGGVDQEPVYSPGALMGAAFFGGGLASVMLSAENSRRQNRLRTDAIWLVSAFVLAFAVIFVAHAQYQPFDARDSSGSIRLIDRASGFVFGGIFYMLHRRAFRTQAMMAIDPPSPWSAVIFVVLVSHGLTVALRAAIRAGMFEGIQ